MTSEDGRLPDANRSGGPSYSAGTPTSIQYKMPKDPTGKHSSHQQRKKMSALPTNTPNPDEWREHQSSTSRDNSQSTSKETTTLPKPGFGNYSTTPSPIDSKFSQHHLSYSRPPLINFQTRRSSCVFLIARVVVVVVPLYPCHTPVRGKTTRKIRNPHHIKPLSTSPNNKNNSNSAENFS